MSVKHDRRREVSLARAQQQREAWAVALADTDREILRLRDEENLTLAQIGIRIGASRVAAGYRLAAARRREAIRQQMPEAIQRTV